MNRRASVRNILLTVVAVACTDAMALTQDRLDPSIPRFEPVPTLDPPPLPKKLVPAPLEKPPAEPKKLEPVPIQQPLAPVPVEITGPSSYRFFDQNAHANGYLTGNQNFPNFIGFISNPIQSLDPRATTEIYPIFGAAWASPNNNVLPGGNLQLYGAGLNVALSDRLAIGLNQGGYAVARFSSDRQQILRNLGLPVPEIDRPGLREGWLNLGGYAQYTLIADVPNQFILTAGMRWEAPSGATQVFQGGSNPAYLSPYLTVGKECGCWHILATTGYEFPAGSGTATTSDFYLNLHIDRKIGWLYPLIELNGAYHTSNVDVNINTPHHGVIDLGTFSSTGNILSVAVGADAVIVPGKLEFGAVYIRPVTAQNHFDSNSVLVKLTYRY
jgi:hypothetical protein